AMPNEAMLPSASIRTRNTLERLRIIVSPGFEFVTLAGTDLSGYIGLLDRGGVVDAPFPCSSRGYGANAVLMHSQIHILLLFGVMIPGWRRNVSLIRRRCSGS